MPTGKPRKGYKKSKWLMSELGWHLREIDKLLTKLRYRINNARNRSKR